MSNDQPPPGQPPPEDDPFVKKPQDSQGPQGQGPQEPPPGTPSGGADGNPPPGTPYGGADGNPPPAPPYDPNAPGGRDPFGGTDPLSGMPPLAPFGRRLMARVIDALIVFIPLAALSLIFGGFTMSSDSGDEWNDFTDQVNSGRQWVWSLISVVAYVGYDTLMISKNGQTLGKRWLKLRVGMLNNGAVPPVNASLLRALVLWLPALVCCFCIWWVVIIITILASRPYRQGLHDKAGRTVVVEAPE